MVYNYGPELVVSNDQSEGNVLFNDTLDTFNLRLYGIRYIVMCHSDNERKPAAATSETICD